MASFRRVILWASNLKVAIGLLFVIAIACALGTAIPQDEASSSYIESYNAHPWLGIINGELILNLNLDHVYSSNWFLALLIWLGFALIVCSWRRQLPSLQAAIKWIDYKEAKQLSKLAIVETISISESKVGLEKLSLTLQKKGWVVKEAEGRLAARKGVIGRAGPPLVHIGLILLMLGSAWGALAGQRLERFLTPGRSFELLNNEGESQVTLKLEEFNIERDPAGRTEQFRSKLALSEPGQVKENFNEISVNHPLRYKGLTVYQADWSLAAITLEVADKQQLQLPLTNFKELGDQIWGLVIPTKSDGSEPILLSLSSEEGPVQIFNEAGELLGSMRPGGSSSEIKGIQIRIIEIIPASGLLLKRDPGVPLVYTGFTITLIGGLLSVLSTRQLWAVADTKQKSLHVGGLCNRDLSGLANEIPRILASLSD